MYVYKHFNFCSYTFTILLVQWTVSSDPKSIESVHDELGVIAKGVAEIQISQKGRQSSINVYRSIL
jgi:hypothetical protein